MYCKNCGTEIPKSAIRCNECGTKMEVSTAKEFYSYDYVTLDTSQQIAREAIDSYEVLGWELIESYEGTMPNKVALNFKRDRKIKNKEQLLKLQIRTDDLLKGIKILESKKLLVALIIAITVGLIGCLLITSGILLSVLLGTTIAIIFGVLLSVIGLIICGFGYLLYQRVFARKEREYNFLITKKRDELANICEEVNKLWLKNYN